MNEIKRKYGLTDLELAAFAGELAVILGESLPRMSKYGITTQKINDLADLGNAFEVFPPDAYYVANITDAVIDRNAKRREIVKQMKDIVVRAKVQMPEKFHRYDRFTSDDTERLSAVEFIASARNLAVVAGQDLAALAQAGLAQPELDALDAAAQEMDDLQKIVNENVRIRTDKAQERVVNGNEIYALVARYAALGKSEYADNPAQYDKFVIYSDADVPKTPPAAPIIEEIDGYAELIFNQDVTSSRIRYKFAAAGEFTEVVKNPNEPHFIGLGHAIIYLEGEGRNAAGWGATATRTIIRSLAPPINPRYHIDRFLWGKSEGAEQVELEVSYDNGVTYQQIFISADEEYIWTPPSGTIRARFRTIAGGVTSDWLEITVVIP